MKAVCGLSWQSIMKVICNSVVLSHVSAFTYLYNYKSQLYTITTLILVHTLVLQQKIEWPTHILIRLCIISITSVIYCAQEMTFAHTLD